MQGYEIWGLIWQQMLYRTNSYNSECRSTNLPTFADYYVCSCSLAKQPATITGAETVLWLFDCLDVHVVLCPLH